MIKLARTAALTAAALVAAVALSGTARAQDPVYFRAGSFDCAIAPDGAVGCDLATALNMTVKLAGVDIPLPFQVKQVVIDLNWAPAHPAFGSGNYTRPQGNPPIDEVATGGGTWGPEVSYAGATCGVGFHGSFWCNAKGHAFASYVGTISGS